MTPIAFSQFVRGALKFLHLLGRRLVGLIDGIAEARTLAERYNTLSRMSDTELARLGLKSEEVAHAVFASRGH